MPGGATAVRDGLVVVCILSVAYACGGGAIVDGGPGGGGGQGGNGVGQGAMGVGVSDSSSTVGPGSSTGAVGTGGSTGAVGTGGAGTLLSCAGYCAQVNANCSDKNRQYAGLQEENCLAFCSYIPAGTADDMTGDTRGCRAYHSGAPALADPALHCPHGGPYGSGVCAPDGGDQCDVFCGLIQAICTGGDQQYATLADCVVECSALSDATTPFVADPAVVSDSFQCRGYHLTAASLDPAVHCAHAGGDGPCVP